MPSIKFSPDQTVAYKLHRRALSEGRSIAAVVKSIVDKELATTAAPTPAVEIHEVGDKVVVGAYLSGALANAIERIADDTGRSKSHILRALVSDALTARGLLAPTNSSRFLDSLERAAAGAPIDSAAQ